MGKDEWRSSPSTHQRSIAEASGKWTRPSSSSMSEKLTGSSITAWKQARKWQSDAPS